MIVCGAAVCNVDMVIVAPEAAGFADVTVGTNLTVGGSNACKIYCVATIGYDTVTGLGVPIVSAFLAAYK